GPEMIPPPALSFIPKNRAFRMPQVDVGYGQTAGLNLIQEPLQHTGFFAHLSVAPQGDRDAVPGVGDNPLAGYMHFGEVGQPIEAQSLGEIEIQVKAGMLLGRSNLWLILLVERDERQRNSDGGTFKQGDGFAVDGPHFASRRKLI